MSIGGIRKFLELIKFEHTAFALPFAYLGMALAEKRWPGARVFFWVTAAMVSARTAAMALNRLIDVRIDEKNPRTSSRPTVTGEISLRTVALAAAAALILFFLSAFMLNSLCFMLSPPAVILLSGYSYVKRFSWLCHFALGLVLAIAPLGGWIAVTGSFSWTPVTLGLAVLSWVAGFDILYSLQDIEVDRAWGLHSIPARFGQAQALRISGFCHAAAVVFLILFGFWDGLGILYWVGIGVVAALLKIEHTLVSDGDLTRLNAAFFTLNSWIGVLLLVFTWLEIFR